MDDDEKMGNSMIASAMKSLSPEEMAQYKRVGTYMYNPNFTAEDRAAGVVSNFKKDTPEQLLISAEEGLRSGMDPFDLSQLELYMLHLVYGNDWYLEFDLEEAEVPPKPEKQNLVDIDKEQEMRLRKYKKVIYEERNGKKWVSTKSSE